MWTYKETSFMMMLSLTALSCRNWLLLVQNMTERYNHVNQIVAMETENGTSNNNMPVLFDWWWLNSFPGCMFMLCLCMSYMRGTTDCFPREQGGSLNIPRVTFCEWTLHVVTAKINKIRLVNANAELVVIIFSKF